MNRQIWQRNKTACMILHFPYPCPIEIARNNRRVGRKCASRCLGGLRAVLVVGLLLMIASLPVLGIVVNFPDTNLEQAIREKLNRPTGDICDTDLIDLWSLEAPERSIVDLEGIQHCVDLMLLHLDDNQISDIAPLAGLTNLMWLFLGGNQISDIVPVAGLTNLTWLFLINNQISDIVPVAGLTNLTELGLSGNQISNVAPVAGLTNLTVLGLDANQISDIAPLAGLTDLMAVSLIFNQITDIAPLVSNIGIDSGDKVYIQYNYLDLTPGSDDIQNIQALINRGVDVEYEPQNTPGNHSPIADAGLDQTVTDTDGNGREQVSLDGSGSADPDGSIVSCVWTENGDQIATGEMPTITLSVDVHTITLTVTDNAAQPAIDTDTIVITVVAPSAHIVTRPNTPSGPYLGQVGELLFFSTGGSTCSQGHSVQYRFDWDNGNYSNWSSATSASYSYSSAGTYQVKAQAHCASDTSVLSNWSSAKTVVIEVISENQPPGTQIDSSDVDEAEGTATFIWIGSDDTTPTTELTYSYRLVRPGPAYDDWSSWSSGKTKKYTDLSPGNYMFQVRARDADEVIDPSPASKEFTIGKAAQGTIMGRVTDASIPGPSNGIVGAVLLLDPDPLEDSMTTDETGRYSLAIPEGTYTVTATAAGYASSTATDVVVEGGSIIVLDFALVPVDLAGYWVQTNQDDVVVYSNQDAEKSLKILPEGWVLRELHDTVTSTVTTYRHVEDITDGITGWVESDALVRIESGERAQHVVRGLATEESIALPTSFLIPGSEFGEGNEVVLLQYILMAENPYAGDRRIYSQSTGAPGNFGPKTTEALQTFQRAQGLEATGRLDVPTRTLLNDRIAAGRYDLVTTRAEVIVEEAEDIFAAPPAWLDNDFLRGASTNIKIEILLAVLANESYPAMHKLDNELISTFGGWDWGRGLMQVTTDGFVGEGSRLTYCVDGNCDCRGDHVACKSYYTNTRQGIRANLLDGLWGLNEKWGIFEKTLESRDDELVDEGMSITRKELLWMRMLFLYQGVNVYELTTICEVYKGWLNEKIGGNWSHEWLDAVREVAKGSDSFRECLIACNVYELTTIHQVWDGRSNNEIGGDQEAEWLDAVREVAEVSDTLRECIMTCMEARPPLAHKTTKNFFYVSDVGDRLSNLDSSASNLGSPATGFTDTELGDKFEYVNENVAIIYITGREVLTPASDLAAAPTRAGVMPSDSGTLTPSFSEDGIAIVFLPPSESTVALEGVRAGTYSLKALLFQGDDAVLFSAVNTPIERGALHLYTLDWAELSLGESGAVIQIDTDGNGTFDETVRSGVEFDGGGLILPDQPDLTERAIILGPNPVTGDGTAFFYLLPEGTSTAKLMIFSITGRLVFETSLNVDSTRFPNAGTWNPVNQDDAPLANGPYVYVLIADGKVIGKGKMVIQR